MANAINAAAILLRVLAIAQGRSQLLRLALVALQTWTALAMLPTSMALIRLIVAMAIATTHTTQTCAGDASFLKVKNAWLSRVRMEWQHATRNQLSWEIAKRCFVAREVQIRAALVVSSQPTSGNHQQIVSTRCCYRSRCIS